MTVRITGGKVFDSKTHRFIERDIYYSGGKIVDAATAEKTVYTNAYIVPGYVDIHTHGRAGIDVLEANCPALTKLSLAYAQSGTTTVFPTVMTAPMEKIRGAIDNIRSALDAGASFAGIHVEGPYISPKKPGCHDASLIRKPVFEELQALAKSIYPLKTRFTIAPEECDDGVIEKLAWLSSVSIGHTNATAEQCEKALKDGASSFTHTFNAMTSLTHRNTGAAGAALASSAFAEFICDGLHVSPTALKAAYNAKLRYPGTFVIITDSIPQAGLPYGDYVMNGISFTLNENGAKRADGTIVGSAGSMHRSVLNLMKFCDITFEQALVCATENPAKAVGLFDKVGSLDVGKQADMLLLDEKYEIRKVIARGNEII